MKMGQRCRKCLRERERKHEAAESRKNRQERTGQETAQEGASRTASKKTEQERHYQRTYCSKAARGSWVKDLLNGVVLCRPLSRSWEEGRLTVGGAGGRREEGAETVTERAGKTRRKRSSELENRAREKKTRQRESRKRGR